jgi:O-antigen/teichoic acid export membrane protein
MSILKDILRPNQLFALIAKGLEGTKVIIINVIIARNFGPEIYGKYSFIIGLVSLVALLAEFRLINIIVKEVSLMPSASGEIIGSSLLINLFFSFIGFFIVMFLSYMYIYDSIIYYGLMLYSVTYFYKIPRAFRAYFVAIGKNVFNVISEFFASIVCLASIAVVIAYSGDIYAIMFLRTLDFLYVYAVIALCFVLLKDKVKLSMSIVVIRRLFFSALPLVISGFVLVLFQRIDVFMIKYYLGDEQVGFYSAAMNYMMIFSIPAMVLSESMAPNVHSNGSLLARSSFLKSVVWVGAVMSFLMLITVSPMIVLIYGEIFSVSVSCAMILSLSPFLIGLGSSAGQLIIKDGVQNKAVVKSILACLINILLNYFLIPEWGINGAAASTVISFLVAYYLSHYFIRDLRGIFFEQCKAVVGR